MKALEYGDKIDRRSLEIMLDWNEKNTGDIK